MGGSIFLDYGETDAGGVNGAGSAAFGAIGRMARKVWSGEVLGGDEIRSHCRCGLIESHAMS